MSSLSGRRVVIVGAGLAGLACARVLRASGIEVAVLEASDGVGGRVRTDTVDGFLLDRGFQVLLRAYPEVHRQVDVAALDLRAFDPGALIRHDTGFARVADPFRSPRHLPHTLIAAVQGHGVTVADLFRLALLRRSLRRVHPVDLLRRPDRSTIDALTARGFSTTAIESFFGPLVGGIQLDPSLSTSARMFEVIMRMLLDDSAGVPATGMGALPIALAAPVRNAIHLNTAVTALANTTVNTVAGSEDGDAVVIATDGPTAARLLDIPEPGSRPASAVHFSAPRPPSTTKTLILDHRGPARNVAIMSNVAPAYAAEGRTLITAAVPGIGAESNLDQHVLAQLATWWGPEVLTWETLRVDHIPHGQPQQSPPLHPRRTIRHAPGVYVCGDHRDTGSIQGALFSGRRCAEAVLHDFGMSAVTGTVRPGDN